jgi:hypothetical protein
MSPRRFALEFTVFAMAAAGAVLGYSAGQQYGPPIQAILAFVGMGVGGALTDLCLRGTEP